MRDKIGDYIFAIGRAVTWLFRSLLGKPVPRYILSTADSTYYQPSQAVIDKAFVILAERKIAAGFIRANYRAESRDCDNSALWDYNELLNDILPELLKDVSEAQGKGLDCGMFSFARDGGKGRHRVAYVTNNDGERTYSDSYEINGTIKRTLSSAEKAAGYDLK